MIAREVSPSIIFLLFFQPFFGFLENSSLSPRHRRFPTAGLKNR